MSISKESCAIADLLFQSIISSLNSQTDKSVQKKEEIYSIIFFHLYMNLFTYLFPLQYIFHLTDWWDDLIYNISKYIRESV